MKKYSVLLFLIFGIIILFILPRIFIKSTWGFDFTTNNASNIGSAIGGVTAPIIGVLSSFLIYFAYNEQRRANKKADNKRNFDILYTLFNDTKKRFFELQYKSIEGADNQGKYALNVFRNDVISQAAIEAGGKPKNLTKVLNTSYRNELIESLDLISLIKKNTDTGYSLLQNERELLIKSLSLFFYKNLKIQLKDIEDSLKDLDDIKVCGRIEPTGTKQLKVLKESVSGLLICFDGNVS
ncbi:hypothetical protein [Saccharicrinis fermentans]|uniref:Phage abortive infection protein n=1 Tax=Saccharicrinis fermentans DSM 9555 = JCM 21142 TaxID=869213 RepID=W7YEW4_9BACT|nr:hypothetical protein [Saccharicrinis fermentans]GAF06013.1 hypothetical protein JCM21142_134780 [Saccharicrinis fermentans DSM 9555 = JCM 21142]